MSQQKLIFQVEGIIANRKEAIIISRIIQSDEKFTLGEKSTLKNVPIKQSLAYPRSLNTSDANPEDLFGFQLLDPKDVSNFKEDEKVTLKV
jgi:hypothetical protein